MHEPRKVPALRVRQWLADWDAFPFDDEQRQRRPEEHFYVLSLSAADLRALSGINRRSVDKGLKRSEDLGVQRQHDRDRSDEIRRYVNGGYPWSSISRRRQEDPASEALKKPGWLPTAIVVNILQPGERRGARTLAEDAAVRIEKLADEHPILVLPDPPQDGELPPIEIIDGQHRLFAFEKDEAAAKAYDLPVVAFVGLDLSWQAYLFWTINIKPKRINPSFAYDLYPLLREESWLADADETIHVYRESRSQELTEVLWASPASPWYQRINMLGGARSEYGPVTQAAFIRSLTLSLVKKWSTGGLFGGTPDGREGLAWSRPQQGAFLLEAWRLLAAAVEQTDASWAQAIRDLDDGFNLELPASDLAFASSHSLLATDQGVRAFQQVLNDIFYRRAERWDLRGWSQPDDLPPDTVEAVTEVLPSLRDEPWYDLLGELVRELTSFDWRTASAPGLEADERRVKQALRGSGGYKILRIDLLRHLASRDDSEIAEVARDLVGA
jgi:DGQHR domain-containing protein